MMFSFKNLIFILGIHDTCDHLKLAISETSADVEGLQEELSIHVKAADEGYDALKKDITLCKNSHK